MGKKFKKMKIMCACRSLEYNNNNNNNNNNNIPVIIGATGTISELPRQYLSNVPGKHEIKEMKTTTVLDTVHLLRKVLM
jgi:hypothetical protein